ncbi:Quercetin 2,3-dioxygenase [Ephemeroptericola cinctiostellae]|uniref:Quercetin 2,3-dioxygenase n=1 Tax=Ephemeroptericola cinctiostellae TaxID=2268024 RepID=A0A345D7R6_9BURK|nr:pirin family protein [Ephemeroptericola cinctiostellae]AXF84404.1 Quercetin 2,3-dioxygenase [Ephemeroptericola cinctiostellae]
MRKVRQIYNATSSHWVGNGFLVQPLFSHMGEDKQTDPFLMLDYGAPRVFEPNAGRPRGVGQHPHKGFETVTIAYAGEVAHRDSSGGGGVIGAGDVQWMTAGRGIIHEEFHSEAFGRTGGEFEMVQLWVNLPKKDKNTRPRYQELLGQDIQVVPLNDGAGFVRVIAGEFNGVIGAAQTFTEMNVWDVLLNPSASTTLTVPEGHNLLMVVLRGEVLLNGGDEAKQGQLIGFDMMGGDVQLQATGDAAVKILLLSGVPIDEPVVGYGPFVMNTEAEIQQAITDFNQGRFGQIV